MTPGMTSASFLAIWRDSNLGHPAKKEADVILKRRQTSFPSRSDGPEYTLLGRLGNNRGGRPAAAKWLFWGPRAIRERGTCRGPIGATRDGGGGIVTPMREPCRRQSPRLAPSARACNIGLRTVHIGVTGILFGGHVFAVPERQLQVWLALAILTGAGLVVLEAYPSLRWLYQGRGICVLLKLLLLGSIPWLWPWRSAILALVVVIASVGSHMPSRYRYFSCVHGRVLD